MLFGAHVPSTDPLGAAAERGADLVQIFLSAPQSYHKPKERDDEAELAASGLPIVVHAPYLINVATAANRVRHPSRALLQSTIEAASRIGARAVVVHGGHMTGDDDVADGFANWRSTFERLETDIPVLIENAAGGDNAIARHFDRIGRLWEALDGIDAPYGFCLDTCHTHAGGEDVATSVERIEGLVGRIDLLHLNDSKDARGSGRDRHQNLGQGEIGIDALLHVVEQAGADVILETPETQGGEHQVELAFLRDRLGATRP